MKLQEITDKELIDTLLDILNVNCRTTDKLFIINTDTNEIFVQDTRIRVKEKTTHKYLVYVPLAKLIDNYIIKL